MKRKPIVLHSCLCRTMIASGLATRLCAGNAELPPEPEGILGLTRVLELAVERNPELAGAAQGIQVAEGMTQQTGVWPNPDLELVAEEFAGSGGRRGYDAAQTTLQLSQSIELGGKRTLRYRVAQSDSRLAAWDHEVRRLDLLSLAKKTFVDVLLAQEKLALAESLMALAAEVRQAARERVKAGKVPPLEETRAGVEVALAGIARERALRELDTARKRLAATWGGTRPVFKLAGGKLDNIGNLPARETPPVLPDNVPELARWREEVVRAGDTLGLARANRYPDIQVSAGVRRFEEDGTYAATAGISLPLPLFDRKVGNLDAARHQISRVEYEQRAACLRVATDLVEASNRLKAARAEALALQAELLPGAQQAFEAAQAGYRAGKIGYLEVLDMQRTVGEAKLRYLDVLASCHKSAADVERLTGISLNTIH